MANKLIAKFKKEKVFADILAADNTVDEYLSTNCAPVNLLFSGKILGGIKKGKMSTICADSGWGKSLIGLNCLAVAYKSGMSCVVIDTENAFNTELAASLGVDLDDILIFKTSRIPEIKQIYGRINHGLTRAESREIFVLFDSWGPIVEEQVMEKAEEASSAVNMSSAKFKNELANIINACGNTSLIVNHVYESLQMYGDKFAVPGGKRLFFNSDAIVLASSAAKAKDKEGNIYGKVITAGVKKGRAAKEFSKTKFLIEHSGGINPYFGLLDDAVESGAVIKVKQGVSVVYQRPDIDAAEQVWREADLYCAAFWIPLYKNEQFNHYVERKYAFEDTQLVSSVENIMDLMNADPTSLSMQSIGTNRNDDEDADDLNDHE